MKASVTLTCSFLLVLRLTPYHESWNSEGVGGWQAPEPQATTPMALKDRYHAVEVGKFAVLEEVEFQTDYIQSLQDEIAKEFGKSQQFKQVLLPGQEPAGATTSTLRLSGTVTYFDPGNRCPVIRLIRSFKSCGIADRHLSGINELGD